MELLCQHRQAELLRQMLLQIPGDAGDGPLLLLLRLCGGGNPALKQGNFQIAFFMPFSFCATYCTLSSQQPPNRRLLASVHNIRMPENKKVPFAKYANDTHEDSDTVFVLQNSDTVM